MPSIWIDTATGTWGGPVDSLRIVTVPTAEALNETAQHLYGCSDSEIQQFGIENGEAIKLNN